MAEYKKKILLTKNLVIGYKSKVLCDNINIDLESGSIIALMGINGSGKSTLMKSIVGLIPALSGEIFIDGKEINSYHRTELAQKISVVLTDHIITRDMTVFETVSFGRYPHTSWMGRLTDFDNQIVMRSVAEVGLVGFEKRTLGTLSDGELQRVMIARALAQETNILFLDEPASHLDIPNKALIINILKNLALNQGKTIIYSTHELSFIRKAADRVWIFDQNNRFLSVSPEEGFSTNLFQKIFGNILNDI